MKKALLWSIATFALLITACSGESSSNASSPSFSSNNDPLLNTNKNSSSNTGNGLSRTASLYVNEAQHILVMSLDKWTDDMCVVEGDNFTWKTMDIYVRPDSSYYEFHGDTLLLYGYDEGRQENYGQMLTGGSAGNIYGKWTYIGCGFLKDENKTECSTSNQKYYYRTLTFSKGTVEIYYEFDFDRYIADHDDYMNSYFMIQLLQTLAGKYYSVELYEIMYMDSAEVQSVVEENNIVFTQKTKTNAIFNLGGKTFTVNAQVNRSLQETGYFAGNDNNTIHVEVSDGATVCKADYISQYINSSYCKAEYKDNLRIEDDWEDSYRNKFTAAEKYRYDNENEFRTCLQGISVQFDPMENAFPSNYSQDVLAKKSATPSTEEKKLLRKWAKYGI